MPPKRLLLVIVARIGDTLLATPAIRALASSFPEAQLDVVVHPQRKSLLLNSPHIHRLLPFTKRSAFWRGWSSFFRGKPYDRAVVYGHDEALLRYALRTSREVVVEAPCSVEGASNLQMVSLNAGAQHAVRGRLALAEKAGAIAKGYQLDYFPYPEELVRASHVLKELSGPGDEPAHKVRWIGFQLQSFPSKQYRDWPFEHFAELASRLLALEDIRIVVLGDQASVDGAEKLCARFPGGVFSLAGKLTLRETAAVQSLLALYVGVDTGPTHLAGALGVPMVAMYHCKHPGKYLAPLDHPSLTVIEHPQAGGACTETSGMAEVTVDQVWAAAQVRLKHSKEV